MPGRVAEHVVRRRPFGRPVRLRVDLHGVSVLGPGDQRQVMRWEWIEAITVGDGVVVAGGGNEIALPPGAFGLASDVLAERLRAAGSLEHRTDVISELSTAAGAAGD